MSFALTLLQSSLSAYINMCIKFLCIYLLSIAYFPRFCCVVCVIYYHTLVVDKNQIFKHNVDSLKFI
jgi:hypothetical protein